MRLTSPSGIRKLSPSLLGGSLPSGRWFRRGRMIVVDLGGKPRAGEQEVEGEVPFTRRVINPRIDVSAQRALITMSNGSSNDQLIANEVLTQVELENLGVYQQDQRRPALLARKFNLNWWELLPAGENFGILCDPDFKTITQDPYNRKELAVFVFRKNLSRPLLINELRRLEGIDLVAFCKD